MRIVHLLEHGVPGNSDVHLAVDLACAQADAGHQVVFVTVHGSFDDLLRAHGVDVVKVPETGGIPQVARVALALLALTWRFGPDVIHAHMLSSALIGAGMSMLTRVPLLTTVHNSFGKHSVLKRLGVPVVVGSEAECQLLLSRGYRPTKVVTVINGTHSSPRDADAAIDPLPRPSVTTLLGLQPHQAVHDIAGAFAQTRSEFPAWNLNIVGSGVERERLEAHLAELSLDGSDGVRFIASTPKLGQILEHTDIFAWASLVDTYPLAEARKAGCAIIATRGGDVAKMLDHGKAGQLVPPSDSNAMAKAFHLLMTDEVILAKWRARAKDDREDFTISRVAEDYLQLYRRLRPAADRGRTRIAYFVPPSRHFAGIERVVHEIATGLMETHGDRLDVHVMFASDYDEPLLVDTVYTRHTLGVRRLRTMLGALRSCVARNKFDVLVVPQVEASVLAWLATRGLRLPALIPHLHGNPRVEETEGTLRTRLAFVLFRHLVQRRVNGVLAVAPSLRRYAADSVARHTPVYFAKNPVRDLGATARGSITQSHEAFRFVNVGRLSQQKGQDILLRALAVARADLPRVQLTLVGNGPEEAALRELCTALGLDDVVTFTGYSADPAEHLRAADCFVLASRWEGFGVVLVEALQFGLPLLATNCEFGPADVITDPRIGELVRPNSAEALASGLRRAATREQKSEDVAFRRKIAQDYAREEATAMHLKILQQIAASSTASPTRLAALKLA